MNEPNTNDASGTEISMLLSVYSGDKPGHVDTAIESIFWQTQQPAELVIVQDGPIRGELAEVLTTWQQKLPETVNIVVLDENQGLGRALQVGLEHCSYELVARMDADDISVPTRLEKQVAFMTENPNVDVLGGYIAEFSDDPDQIDSIRSVPTDSEEAAERAAYRCPLNHPTVMYRKSAILAAGGYGDRRSMQDHELWIRLLNHGYTITNLPEVLVKARAGAELYDRRGGFDYAKTEFLLYYEFLQSGYITFLAFMVNILYRIPVRLAPKPVRGFIYNNLLR